ncbi:MAG: hypothetical protein OWQ54_02280 [Sulfolobaceae archaeon]|nr:hypothetical protein [Sulfolobaceae archaeon]
MPKRRSRVGILYDILEALESGPMNLTNLMYKSNLPYDRFREIIDDMKRNGLIVEKDEEGGKKVYYITKKGMEALNELRNAKKVLKSFGIDLE